MLLVFAARAQHYHHVIVPALERGDWVLSDRFVDASFVYQGEARGLGAPLITQLESMVLGEFKADHVIILDAELSVTKSRAESRGDLDRFESEADVFHSIIREAYLKRAQGNNRYSIIDAQVELSEVRKSLEVLITQLIKEFNL